MHRLTCISLTAAALALAGAAPASADSISFLRGGDVWVASSDGSKQVQLTRSGAYEHQSQADDGTIIALTGRRLHRIGRDGRVLADFDTPVSGAEPGPSGSRFSGPFDPVVSPDGRKVAYEYFHTAIEPVPGCLPLEDPRCQRKHISAGIGYSHADRQTGWDEPGLGRQSGWMDPSWIGNEAVLLSDKSVRPNLDAMLDHPGDGNQTIDGWFEDTGVWHVRDGEMTRAGDAVAFVTTRPKDPGEDLWEDDQVTIYRTNGAPPALPESCYSYRTEAGGYSGATWSPDGGRIAFEEHAHRTTKAHRVLVAAVPSQAGGCRLPDAGASVLLEDARNPDWGPADVPAAPLAPDRKGQEPIEPGPEQPEDKTEDGSEVAPAPELTVRRAKLRKALVKGLVVKASGLEPGRVTLTARRGRKVVARGTGTADARGRATVRLRFTRPARRALRSARRATLVVTGGGVTRAVRLRR